MSTFNNKCPVCGSKIHVINVTVRCDETFSESGWSIKATHENTNGSESFSCPKCEVTIPADWVYKDMTEKEAQKLMGKWGANVMLIHNLKPLPEEGGKPSKKDSARTMEPSSPSTAPTGSKTRKGAGKRRLTSSDAKTDTPSSSPAPQELKPLETTSDDSIFA